MFGVISRPDNPEKQRDDRVFPQASTQTFPHRIPSIAQFDPPFVVRHRNLESPLHQRLLRLGLFLASIELLPLKADQHGGSVLEQALKKSGWHGPYSAGVQRQHELLDPAQKIVNRFLKHLRDFMDNE
jgi:hypothetical protein